MKTNKINEKEKLELYCSGFLLFLAPALVLSVICIDLDSSLIFIIANICYTISLAFCIILGIKLGKYKKQ